MFGSGTEARIGGVADVDAGGSRAIFGEVVGAIFGEVGERLPGVVGPFTSAVCGAPPHPARPTRKPATVPAESADLTLTMLGTLVGCKP
jgi:hypothetical protein